MAQRRLSHSNLRTRPRTLSADYTVASRSSMLFSILASAVQAIPNLRRSASVVCGERPQEDGSGDLAYTSAMVLRDVPLDGHSRTSSEGGEEGYFAEQATSDSEPSHSPQLEPPSNRTEEKTGMKWKYANQGLNLLSLSFSESGSATRSQDPRFGNDGLARQLYIHSLTYLLRALPEDLTAEEEVSVRGALPMALLSHTEPPPRPASEPSLLHRTLASTIVQLFILLQFVLPYLKYLLTAAYRYEREHKIAEKVLRQGVDAVDMLGRQSVQFTAAIYEIGEGRVGQVIGDGVKWVVDGVTGGIHEGVGEGMVRLVGPREEESSEKRR